MFSKEGVMAYKQFGMREYPTFNALLKGEEINFEGVKLKMDGDGKVRQGDLYVAERNTGPKLLTAREIVMSECGCCISYIIPTSSDYCFDGTECVKVCEA